MNKTCKIKDGIIFFPKDGPIYDGEFVLGVGGANDLYMYEPRTFNELSHKALEQIDGDAATQRRMRMRLQRLYLSADLVTVKDGTLETPGKYMQRIHGTEAEI